ncbi:hypothetical protein WP1_061 [Pseudomonas phage WP1]
MNWLSSAAFQVDTAPDLIAVEGRPGEQERAEATASTGTSGHCRVGEVGRLAGDVHDAGGGPAEGDGPCRCGSADFATARTPVPMVAPTKVNWLVFGFQVTMAWANCGSVFLRISAWMIDATLSMEVAADVSMAAMFFSAAPTMMVRTPAEKPAKSAMVFGRLSPTTIGAMAVFTQRAKLILDGELTLLLIEPEIGRSALVFFGLGAEVRQHRAGTVELNDDSRRNDATGR